MNVLDAAHRIGLDAPGGITGLAPRMGIDPAILRSKLNPNCETNHLTLKQAVLMQTITGRADILHAMAEELGYVVVPLPTCNSPSLPQAITRACAEFGDYMRKVNDAIDDGQVTPNEAKQLEKALTWMMASASSLQAVTVGDVVERRKVAIAG